MTATDVVPISLAHVQHAANDVVNRWRGQHVQGVYGPPRGGLVPAALVAGGLGVGMTATPPCRATDERILVVDDLVDSGRTLRQFVDDGYKVDALFRKPTSPAHIAPDAQPVDGWLVFPWESDESTGPEDAVVRLLNYVGEDPDRDGLIDTPGRVVRAFKEMTAGYHDDPAVILERTFDERHDQMVVLDGLDFTSLCEHHLLPFVGTAVVGYVPRERVVGISKLARLVECFARRLQVQERMTDQIADALMTHLRPEGAGVVIRAHHSCMGCRGVRKPNATMTTSSLHGIMRHGDAARAEFLAFAHAAAG